VQPSEQFDVRAEVASNPHWYHTMDLGGGVITPGWFDQRTIVSKMPWPDVAGKRCLDVGTYDGFLAFEMERRGAKEVVALDIASHEDWDWPPRARAQGPAYLAQVSGEKGRGFEIAHAALRSNVERRFISVYDLDAADVGTFDVVVCGQLLLHLSNPFRALEAIRNVCTGSFMSIETIDFRLTAMSPRWPVLRLSGDVGQWMIANVAGHLRMLHIAGFDLDRTVHAFATPLGPGHPSRDPGLMLRARRILEIAYLRGEGTGTHVALVHPAI
jgi:tRNA (mo5U34)-methyltransferase